jgi:SAM-dependent methyltransferase
VTIAWIDQAITWLGDLLADTPVRRVLDIGSGPGVTTCRLAEAFPQAEVVAVDGEPALLERVHARAARTGAAARVRTHQADLATDLTPLGDADLIWTSHVLHHLGDQQSGVTRLAARLRPDGLLAVAEGGLPHRYLPRNLGFGRPGLEARLDAHMEAWFADMRAALPDAIEIIDDWPTMLTTAALHTPQSRTFLAETRPPIDAQSRAHIHHAFTRSREILATRLAPDDKATLDHLLDETSPESLHHRHDLQILDARTLHTARAAAGA